MDLRLDTRDLLLAWINHRLERISQAQHKLALQKTMLQEQATRLRLGAFPDEVTFVLERAGLLSRVGADSANLPGVAGASLNGEREVCGSP